MNTPREKAASPVKKAPYQSKEKYLMLFLT